MVHVHTDRHGPWGIASIVYTHHLICGRMLPNFARVPHQIFFEFKFLVLGDTPLHFL